MEIERVLAIPLDNEQAIKYTEDIVNDNFKGKINKIKYLGGGSFGKAYLISFENQEEIVIKFLRAKNMLAKEVNALETLSKHCPVQMPRVIYSRPADDRIPVDCYAMSKISGKPAFSSLSLFFASKRKRLQFADSVTNALHEIHLCQADKFGDISTPQYDDWLEFYKPFAEGVLNKAEEMYKCGELSKKIITALRAAWEKFDDIFCQKVTKSCLIHGDLNIANVMVDRSNNLSGFIDPLNTMYADNEYDLFQFDNLLGKRFRLKETYIRKFGASEKCDAKCAFYGLYNEVYCYIKSGVLVNFIMNPLIKNMYKRLKQL